MIGDVDKLVAGALFRQSCSCARSGELPPCGPSAPAERWCSPPHRQCYRSALRFARDSRMPLESAQQVLNIEHVAHLPAIAVNRDRPAFERGIEKMRNPALVLAAELARSGNARHPEDHRAQPVNARVITHVLVGRTLGATVRRMEVQRLRFVGSTAPAAT